MSIKINIQYKSFIISKNDTTEMLVSIFANSK